MSDSAKTEKAFHEEKSVRGKLKRADRAVSC